jgi:hypothetical protein
MIRHRALPIGPRRSIPSLKLPHLTMSDTDLLYLEQAIHSGVCFIHIPKCGGTSVKSALGLELKDHPLLCDMISAGLPNNAIKVAIVRDPFDRLVSAYEHIRKGKKQNRIFKSLVLNNYENFDDSVLNWLSETNIYNWIHFLPQTDFLTLDGKLAVDHIYKLEDIEKNWAEVSKIFNAKTVITKNNISDRRPLEDYYMNKDVIKKVMDLYKKDFENLNYKLEI